MTIGTASLSDLANRFSTDKGTQAKEAHGYSLVYDLVLSGLRDKEFNLLELGLAIGGPELGGDVGRKVVRSPSVEMWIEYFPKAQIYGADISDFSKLNYDRFTFVQVDCSEPKEVRCILEFGVKFDVIIDDASHAAFHQQVTFANLFQALQPGGLFVIEDLHWQPEEYKRQLPSVPDTSRWLLDFQKTGVLTPTAGATIDQVRDLSSKIHSVTLYTKAELDAAARLFNCLHGLEQLKVHEVSWHKLLPDIASYGPKRALKARLKRNKVKLAIIQKAWD